MARASRYARNRVIIESKAGQESNVPRSTRTDVTTFLQEVRAMELLANEVDVPMQRMEKYWAVAADLITLAMDGEMLAAEDPDTTNDDPRLLALRRRLRTVGANLAELSLD